MVSDMKLALVAAPSLLAVLAGCGDPSAYHAVFADVGEQIAWIEGSSIDTIGGESRNKNATIVLWTATIDGTRIVEKKELTDFGPSSHNQFIVDALYYLPGAGYAMVVGFEERPISYRIGLDGKKDRLNVLTHNLYTYPSRDGKFVASVKFDDLLKAEVGFTDVEKNEIVAVVEYPVALFDKFLWDDQNRFWVHGLPTDSIVLRTAPTPPEAQDYVCDSSADNYCWRKDTARITMAAGPNDTPVIVTDPACYISETSSGPYRADGRRLEGARDTDVPVIRNLGAPPCVIE